MEKKHTKHVFANKPKAAGMMGPAGYSVSAPEIRRQSAWAIGEIAKMGIRDIRGMARSGGWPVLLWCLSDVMPSRMGIQGDGKMTQTSWGVAAEIRLGAIPTQINKPSFNETKAALADRRKIDVPLRGDRMVRFPFVVGMGLLPGNRSREQTARVRHRRRRSSFVSRNSSFGVGYVVWHGVSTR